jgi:phospholipid transport system substrate-binding protein
MRQAFGLMRYMLGRRAFLGSAATALVLAWTAVPAHAEDPVLAPAHQLIDGLLQVMKAGSSKSFTQRFDMLAPVVDKTFDLTAILKASVGASWSSMPADQQDALLKAFRRYTVASYVNSFDSFNGQKFLVNPEPRSVGNEQVVRTQIIPASGDGHELDYVMSQGPSGWRIVDVLADGAVSRVAVQRSDFRSLIRQGGATALTQSLEAKSVNLAG